MHAVRTITGCADDRCLRRAGKDAASESSQPWLRGEFAPAALAQLLALTIERKDNA
jgi:hypothetical protein